MRTNCASKDGVVMPPCGRVEAGGPYPLTLQWPPATHSVPAGKSPERAP